MIIFFIFMFINNILNNIYIKISFENLKIIKYLFLMIS